MLLYRDFIAKLKTFRWVVNRLTTMNSFRLWKKDYLKMNPTEYFEATQIRWGFDLDLFQTYHQTMAKVRKDLGLC